MVECRANEKIGKRGREMIDRFVEVVARKFKFEERRRKVIDREREVFVESEVSERGGEMIYRLVKVVRLLKDPV